MKLFISYRRDDAPGHAGRLYDALGQAFGFEQIFIDVEQLDPGSDFVDGIKAALTDCQALIVVIGRDWLNAVDPDSGRPRLEDRNDFVAHEIRTALDMGIPVVPVLVHGAAMPRPAKLPQPLRPLARRQAFEVRDSRWSTDVGGLVSTLKRIAQTHATASPDGDPPHAASVARGYSAWRGGGELRARLHDGEGFISAAQFSADGRHLLTASVAQTLGAAPGRGSARVWRVGSWDELRRFGNEPIWSAAISGDSRRLLYRTVLGRLYGVEFDWRAGEDEVSELGSPGSGNVALSRDGRVGAFDVAHLDEEGFAEGVEAIEVYDLDTGDELSRIEYPAQGFALSPDARLLAVWQTNECRVWRVGDRSAVGHFTHDDDVRTAVIASKSVLATGSEDGTVRIWDIASGEQRLLVSHDDAVYAVAICMSAGVLASGCLDHHARVFDADTGRQLARFDCDEEVTAVDFSVEGSMLVAGSGEGAFVWHAAP